MMKTKTILKADALNKTFGTKGKQHQGICDLNLEIGKGEFTAIMGNSGSGKSTLLYLLSGLDQPTSGSISFGDTQIHKLNEKALAILRRKRIGFIFQNHNLITNLSLKENILIAGYLIKKDKHLVHARANMLMQQLEIDSLADRLPSQVSGGEKQRCAIVRALINQPDILMADEPTGSLNSSASEKVLSSFKEVHRMGQSILMVTHDPRSACYADEVIFLKDGELVDFFLFNSTDNLETRKIALTDWLQTKGW